MNAAVDEYFERAGRLRPELERLRTLLIEGGLTEELKWRLPCYTRGGHPVAILQGFRDYCALLFFKGALLADEAAILEPTGENARAGRRLRVDDVGQIDRVENLLRAYVKEAVELQESGRKVPPIGASEIVLTAEWSERLRDDPALDRAFRALTLGRQRAYAMYVASAKRTETRAERVARCVPRILAGRGLNDPYP